MNTASDLGTAALLASLLLGCGPAATGGWTPLGEMSFTNPAARNFAIAATEGRVYVGYWDHWLDAPVVQWIDADGGDWAPACGGPAPLDGLEVDPLAHDTFRFRQAGLTSYVGFDRSPVENELVVFACDGGERWRRLPSVPLELLPGWPESTALAPESFDFTAQDGVLSAVVHDMEYHYTDPKTCLTLFRNEGEGWHHVPDRICSPEASDGFSGYEAYYDYPSVHVSEGGQTYLGYYHHDNTATFDVSANVSRLDGSGWTHLAGPDDHLLGASHYGSTYFALRTRSDTDGDVLALAAGSPEHEAHVLLHRSGEWTTLSSPEIVAPPGHRLSMVLEGCDDCVALAYKDCCTGLDGISVRRHRDGAWEQVGARNFTDASYDFDDDVLATDGERLFLVFATQLAHGGEDTSGTLSVYRYGP